MDWAELLGHPVKGTLELDGNGLWFVAGGRRVVALPWAEVSSVEVDSHEDVSRRITATRLAAVGVFALAVPKTRHACYVVVGSQQGTRIFRIAAPMMNVRAAVVRFSDKLPELSRRPAAEALAARIAAEVVTRETTRRTLRIAGYVCGFLVAPVIGWVMLTSSSEITVDYTEVRCSPPVDAGSFERIPGRLRRAGSATTEEIHAACDDRTSTARTFGLVLLLIPLPTGAWAYYRQRHPQRPAQPVPVG